MATGIAGAFKAGLSKPGKFSAFGNALKNVVADLREQQTIDRQTSAASQLQAERAEQAGELPGAKLRSKAEAIEDISQHPIFGPQFAEEKNKASKKLISNLAKTQADEEFNKTFVQAPASGPSTAATTSTVEPPPTAEPRTDLFGNAIQKPTGASGGVGGTGQLATTAPRVEETEIFAGLEGGPAISARDTTAPTATTQQPRTRDEILRGSLEGLLGLESAGEIEAREAKTTLTRQQIERQKEELTPEAIEFRKKEQEAKLKETQAKTKLVDAETSRVLTEIGPGSTKDLEKKLLAIRVRNAEQEEGLNKQQIEAQERVNNALRQDTEPSEADLVLGGYTKYRTSNEKQLEKIALEGEGYKNELLKGEAEFARDNGGITKDEFNKQFDAAFELAQGSLLNVFPGVDEPADLTADKVVNILKDREDGIALRTNVENLQNTLSQQFNPKIVARVMNMTIGSQLFGAKAGLQEDLLDAQLATPISTTEKGLAHKEKKVNAIRTVLSDVHTLEGILLRGPVTR